MNLADLMLRGAGARMVPYAVGIATAASLGIFAVHSLNRANTAEHELARERERSSLVDHGVPPVEQGSDKDLKAALKSAQEESAVLRASVADAERRVKAATGKSPKVVEVIKYVTAPGPATGEPPPGRPCLVSPGDTLQIRVTGVRLETHEGNHVLAGSASCWRLAPPPETKIAEGPIDLASVQAVEEKVQAVEEKKEVSNARRWGLGPVGSIDTHGSWAVGPEIGYHVWRLDLHAGITFPDQRAIGGVTVRW